MENMALGRGNIIAMLIKDNARLQ